MFGDRVQVGAAKDKAFVFAVFFDEFKTVYMALPGDYDPAQTLKIEKQGQYANRWRFAALAPVFLF